MRKNTVKTFRRKANVVLIVLLIITSMFVTACQPTPETPAVIGKDQQAMLAAAVQPPESEGKDGRFTKLTGMDVPERYTFNTTGADGKLKASADANVTLPGAEMLPIAKVVPRGFTQDMVSGVLSYLYGDTPYYANDKRMTKDEIDDRILQYQGKIASGWYDESPELKERTEALIEELKEQQVYAPEKRDPPKLSDGTMARDVVTGEYSLNVNSVDSAGNKKAWFTCNSPGMEASPFETNFTYLYYSDDSGNKDDYWNFTMDGAKRIYDDSDITDDLKIKLGITFGKAKSIVQGLLNAAGAEGMQCAAAYVIDDHGTGNYDGYTGPASDYAIRLFYTGSVNGVPVLLTADSVQNAKTAYDYSWPDEMLKVTVADDGIIEISWDEPCTVSEVITDCANIMDLTKAAEIFEKKIVQFYEPQLTGPCAHAGIDINVDNVSLGLLRVKQQNREGTKSGLYVPVWAFYGLAAFKYADGKVGYNRGDIPEGPCIMLAVNAVDGSIIDVAVGY